MNNNHDHPGSKKDDLPPMYTGESGYTANTYPTYATTSPYADTLYQQQPPTTTTTTGPYYEAPYNVQQHQIPQQPTYAYEQPIPSQQHQPYFNNITPIYPEQPMNPEIILGDAIHDYQTPGHFPTPSPPGWTWIAERKTSPYSYNALQFQSDNDTVRSSHTAKNVNMAMASCGGACTGICCLWSCGEPGLFGITSLVYIWYLIWHCCSTFRGCAAKKIANQTSTSLPPYWASLRNGRQTVTDAEQDCTRIIEHIAKDKPVIAFDVYLDGKDHRTQSDHRFFFPIVHSRRVAPTADQFLNAVKNNHVSHTIVQYVPELFLHPTQSQHLTIFREYLLDKYRSAGNNKVVVRPSFIGYNEFELRGQDIMDIDMLPLNKSTWQMQLRVIHDDSNGVSNNNNNNNPTISYIVDQPLTETRMHLARYPPHQNHQQQQQGYINQQNAQSEAQQQLLANQIDSQIDTKVIHTASRSQSIPSRTSVGRTLSFLQTMWNEEKQQYDPTWSSGMWIIASIFCIGGFVQWLWDRAWSFVYYRVECYVILPDIDKFILHFQHNEDQYRITVPIFSSGPQPHTLTPGV